MRKLLNILLLLIVVLSACEPNEDLYNELDDLKGKYNESIEYTFTAEDYKAASKMALELATNSTEEAYASMIESNLSFNPVFEPVSVLGEFLADKFPALNEGSVAMVTYDYDAINLEHQMPFASALKYELGEDDYDLIGGDVSTHGIFFPSANVEDNITQVLDSAYKEAEEGDMVYTAYRFSETEAGVAPPMDMEIYSQDFQDFVNDVDSINKYGWINISQAGTKVWKANDYSGNIFAEVSSYQSTGADTAWIIKAIDLDERYIYDRVLTFDVQARYFTHEGLKVYISEDFDGEDFPSATWDDVTLNFNIPAETMSDLANAGELDLTSYGNKTIYVAFRYTGNGTASETTTYRIDNVVVKGLRESYKKAEYYFEYDGSEWTRSNDIRVLQAEDYDAMGTPGKYNNFSEDDSPYDYLPILLENEADDYPVGEVVMVSYKYYNGSKTVIIVEDYEYESGVWSPVTTLEEKTEQYVHIGTGWIFDPTIRLAMTAGDYQVIVDYVKANISADLIDSYGTADFYTGASGYYGNFDLRVSERIKNDPDTYSSLTEEEAMALIDERVQEGIVFMLQSKYPNAVPDIVGIPVDYFITYDTYNNDYSRGNYTVHYRCSSEGTPPQFELIDGPIDNNAIE